MKNEKIQVLVTFPKTANMSKRKAVSYVRDAVHAHSGAFEPGDPFAEQSKLATAREHKGDESIEELREEIRVRRAEYSTVLEENSRQKKEIALLKAREVGLTPADRPDAVVMFNAITHAINGIDHSAWLPKTHQKREYAKLGGRAVLSRVGAAVKHVANTLLSHPAKPTDGDLFMYWVTEAATRPARLMTALAECSSPEEYRTALLELYELDVTEHQAGRIVEEGGLIQV